VYAAVSHGPAHRTLAARQADPARPNPRTHSDAQVAQIAASIAEFGFLNPILVDTKAGILAGNGRLLAALKLDLDAVLANCEWDLFELRGWFGEVAAGRLSVYIDPGSFGAYHANCAATELHLAAFGGTDGALENRLNVAEADEVMMANHWPAGRTSSSVG
jgi:hypothetical protein